MALEALETEAGVRAFAFASGMAATHAALVAAELTGGGTVLAADQLYGSTATLLVQVFGASGVETRSSTRMIWERWRRESSNEAPRRHRRVHLQPALARR